MMAISVDLWGNQPLWFLGDCDGPIPGRHINQAVRVTFGALNAAHDGLGT